MLYGISLIAGLLNTAHLPTIAAQLADKFNGQLPPAGELMVLALGGLMISVGLAFKLSAVPFHFWCPDVFEGATAEVNAFLSIASQSRCPGAARPRRAWHDDDCRPQALRPASGRPRIAKQARQPQADRSASSMSPMSRVKPAARRRADTTRADASAVDRAALQPDSLLHRQADRLLRHHHLHVRQPGRLRPDQHQAAARPIRRSPMPAT